MSSGPQWHAGSEADLAWLESIAIDLDDCGYEVAPMPDKVYVLHPLSERVDGSAMDSQLEPYETVTPSGRVVRSADPLATGPTERILRWREYAERRGIPMFTGEGYASWRDALPGVWDDDLVSPPGEGEMGEPAIVEALFNVLLNFSGSDQMCTARYASFWVGGGSLHGSPPTVLRGALGAWQELFDRPDYGLPPQNLWPDTHQWVLETHVDSWATEISGPTPLAEAFISSPDLEAERLPHLSERREA